MIQFYFLSVFLNALAGYVLAGGGEEDELGIKGGFSLSDETVRLVLGILCMVTGLLKLLSPAEKGLPILGDFIPALVGLLAGFILVLEYYRSHATVESDRVDRLQEGFFRNKRLFGFVAVVSAALHFLFPGVLFL
ncbi:MAG: hypothetical protein LBQ67_06570 [Treponema sp.]|jgi:hypothetical protein|nr:hypothetical protein [Treponema sp.]